MKLPDIKAPEIHVPDVQLRDLRDRIPEIDTGRLESALSHLGEAVSETVTDDIVPAARFGARRAVHTAREHPRVSVGSLLAILAIIGLVMWMRRGDDEQLRHLSDASAAA